MRAAIVLVCCLAADARAGVDWAKGVVTAPGIGIADRHAPSPAAARGSSRRKAEDAGRKALAAELGALPLAGGGKVADKLADPAIAKRIASAVERAYPIDAEPETDGSWRVTMALPLEAVRQALSGFRELAAGASDAGPEAVVIEGVTGKPALGVTVGGVEGATIWVKAVPAWAKDAPRIKAKARKGAAIEADASKATPSTLFVIVTKK